MVKVSVMREGLGMLNGVDIIIVKRRDNLSGCVIGASISSESERLTSRMDHSHPTYTTQNKPSEATKSTTE